MYPLVTDWIFRNENFFGQFETNRRRSAQRRPYGFKHSNVCSEDFNTAHNIKVHVWSETDEYIFKNISSKVN